MSAHSKVPRRRVSPSERRFEFLLRRAARLQRTSALRPSAKIGRTKTMRAA